MFVKPTAKYAGLNRGNVYRLIERGHDYYKVLVKGRPMFVPNFVFEGKEEIEEEDEGQTIAD